MLTDVSPGVVLTRAPAACQLLINIMWSLVFYSSLYCQVNLTEEVGAVPRLGGECGGLSVNIVESLDDNTTRDSLPILSDKRSIKSNQQRKQRQV